MGIVYFKLFVASHIKMGKILKRGRVVILLAGRRAGKKAIIVKQIDEGKKKRKFGHALVVGIERPARKVTSSMSKKKLTRRATIKPFVKYVNNTHLLATRFIVKEDKDFEFRNSITEDQLENPTTRKELLKSIKTKLQTRFLAPEGPGERQSTADFFFSKLRF